MAFGAKDRARLELIERILVHTRNDLRNALDDLTSAIAPLGDAVNALVAVQPASEDFSPEVDRVQSILSGVNAAIAAAKAALAPPAPPQTSATTGTIPPAPMTTVQAVPQVAPDVSAHLPGTI